MPNVAAIFNVMETDPVRAFVVSEEGNGRVLTPVRDETTKDILDMKNHDDHNHNHDDHNHNHGDEGLVTTKDKNLILKMNSNNLLRTHALEFFYCARPRNKEAGGDGGLVLFQKSAFYAFP